MTDAFAGSGKIGSGMESSVHENDISPFRGNDKARVRSARTDRSFLRVQSSTRRMNNPLHNHSPRKFIIAIDGPAGSGKSTIAARLARKFGYINLESGAMYRALALKAMEQQVPLDDAEALRQLAENSTITLEPRGESNRVLLDGRDVSQRIR